DCGTKAGYVQAIIDAALLHAETAGPVYRHIHALAHELARLGLGFVLDGLWRGTAKRISGCAGSRSIALATAASSVALSMIPWIMASAAILLSSFAMAQSRPVWS
ncbi:MAG: hypothetical protein HQL42_20910, partial [Alphaproteobacteria bacterium]|nr:hypothetical protein [Alphaproteobacteria bacterium]